MITKDQIKVYGLLGDMIVKNCLAFLLIVVIASLSFMFIFDPSWKTVVLDAGFGGLLAIFLRHYFPNKHKCKKREEPDE